jgi:hypothetical protein
MAALRRALASLAASRPAIVGESVPWTEVFPGGAQYTQVAGEAVAPLREAVVAASEGAGVPVDRTHPFVAHITLDRAVADDARGRRLPPFVVPFLDLWLCVGRSSCERFPLARRNAARVATARSGLERGRALGTARGRNGWRGQRAAVTGRQDQAVGRDRRPPRTLLRHGAVRRDPHPVADLMAPGASAPLPARASGPRRLRLSRGGRAVETSPRPSGLPRRDPRAAACDAVEKGAPCGERHTDDMLEQDRGRASGLGS